MAYEAPTGRGNAFEISSQMIATAVDRWVWRAPGPCKLIGGISKSSVVGGASAAVRPRKVTSTGAPGAAASATIVELATAVDLTTTVNTETELTLSTTPSDLHFAAGDWLAEDFSGTLTNLVGVNVYRFLEL